MSKFCINTSLPTWLEEITPETFSESFSIDTVLKDSLYYPAAGLDDSAEKYFGGLFYSFVHVDYQQSKEELKSKLKEDDWCKGYTVLCEREITEEEISLTFHKEAPHGELGKDLGGQPFCLWSILQRDDELTDEHGPLRFSFLHLNTEGVAAFQALYVKNNIAPKGIAIIQPGTGFGNNWTAFENPSEPLAKAVLNNPAGQPEYLLYGGWGRISFYTEPCWPTFSKNIETEWQRGNLFKRQTS